MGVAVQPKRTRLETTAPARKAPFLRTRRWALHPTVTGIFILPTVVTFCCVRLSRAVISQPWRLVNP